MHTYFGLVSVHSVTHIHIFTHTQFRGTIKERFLAIKFPVYINTEKNLQNWKACNEETPGLADVSYRLASSSHTSASIPTHYAHLNIWAE